MRKAMTSPSRRGSPMHLKREVLVKACCLVLYVTSGRGVRRERPVGAAGRARDGRGRGNRAGVRGGDRRAVLPRGAWSVRTAEMCGREGPALVDSEERGFGPVGIV